MKTRSCHKILFCCMVGLLGVSTKPSQAFGKSMSVEDEANLFGEQAEIQANKTIQDVFDKTQVRIQVVTKATLSPDVKNADAEAEYLFKTRRIKKGMLILAMTAPKRRLVILASPSVPIDLLTSERIRSLMIQAFGRKENDKALQEGLQEIDNALSSHSMILKQKTVDSSAYSVPAKPPSMWRWVLPGIIIGGIGILFVVLLVRRKRVQSGGNFPGSQFGSNHQAYSGGYANESGSWVKPVVGGVAGAMAGNWLYDRFVRDRDDNNVYEGHHPSAAVDENSSDVPTHASSWSDQDEWGGSEDASNDSTEGDW